MTRYHATLLLALLEQLDIVVEEVTEPSTHSQSPTAFELDLTSRIITAPSRWDGGRGAVHAGMDVSVEGLLHEAMHLLTHPPYASIEEVPEPWILFQVELAYAESLGPDVLLRVKVWQSEVIAANDPESPKFKDYWRQGYRIARKVGLLDAKDRPTYQWPDWTVLTLEERDSWQRVSPELE